MSEDNKARWADLLHSALTVPGTVSKAYSRFWNYSLGNQLLAMWQCALRGIEPGPIATYPAWQKLGRQVKKGSKAIELCMPIIGQKKKTDEQGNETKEGYRFFVFKRNWFVLSQTEGQEYSMPPLPEWDKDRALASLGIAERPFDMINGNVQGYATGKEVAISPLAGSPYKTLFHELGHILLGHTAETKNDGGKTPRDMREVQAESVAMLVGEALQLVNEETLADSRGYIQGWARGHNGESGIRFIPEKDAQKIFHAADQIIRAGRLQSCANGEGGKP